MAEESTQPNPELGQGGNSSGTGGVADQRINDLMSKWQSEQASTQRLQAEVTRLQALLATQVATEANLRDQLSAAGTGTDQKISEAEQRATGAESQVAELQRQVAKLTATLGRLEFLVDKDNKDLIDYAAVLPETADTASLKAAAETIRAARQSDNQSVRNQLAPGRGGNTPRTPAPPPMTASDIETFLRNGPADQFENRLKEVAARIRPAS